ncbi:hypothetical protein V6917_17830 [Pectobacterium brasiliense]|uniref:hypothetical protein n=1 Tax=Pectobacterium brasiliense TaxID=180957 RepID=UPI0030D54705
MYLSEPQFRLNHQFTVINGDDNKLSGIKTEFFQPLLYGGERWHLVVAGYGEAGAGYRYAEP